MPKYNVLKPLPTYDEFAELRRRQFTQSLAESLDDAFSVFQDLAQEMDNWQKNLPPTFRNSSRAEAIRDAVMQLDHIQQLTIEIPASVKNIPVSYIPSEWSTSRATRRNDAVGMIKAAMDAIDSDTGEANELIQFLTQTVQEASTIHFPGFSH